MADADPLSWLVSLEGVGSGFAATRDGIDAMLRDRGLRKTSPEQTGESLLRGAHASAVLAGSASTLEQVRSGDGDGTAAAAVRISTEVLSLAPVVGASPLQAFARIDVLAGGSGQPVAGTSQRLADLGRLLVSQTKAPAMVVAALAHADLVSSAPFGDRSGLVARAVERLLLVARGVDPASLVVPEAGHLALRAEYESNLRGYASGTQPGVHAWLLYACEAFTRGAEASPLVRR